MERRRRPRSVSVEETGESSERRGRGGREAVSKRRTRCRCGRDEASHPGDVGTGAKGSGLNEGCRKWSWHERRANPRDQGGAGAGFRTRATSER